MKIGSLNSISFKESFLFFISLIFLPIFSFAQTTENLISVQIPPAPNAAALAKYGDVPISYFTGTPQIGIPITSISSGLIDLEIGLSYNASGVKVDEIASWVGLGWSLNSGGVLTRVVRGLPDESTSGFFNEGNKIFNESSLADYNYLYRASKGEIDTESDVYFFNFPSGSGKFYMSHTKEIILPEYRDIIIEHPSVNQSPFWRLIDEKGTQFFFGGLGYGNDIGGFDYTTSVPSSGPSLSYQSSWHLARIVSPNKSDTIDFFYENKETINSQLTINETLFIPEYDPLKNPNLQFCLGEGSYSYNKSVGGETIINQVAISKIVHKNGSIEFETPPSNQPRLDLEGGKKLSKITIKTSAGLILKYYTLGYDYFEGNDGLSKRLKLISIKECGRDNECLPPFLFQYNEINSLPPNGSSSVDHWGFYNANGDNDSKIPQIIEMENNTFYYYSEGGVRDSDPILTRAGILEEITYPTGGKTQFDFESHEVSTIQSSEAMEYYEEEHSLVCHFRNDCPAPISFTVEQEVTARIDTQCICFGSLEFIPANTTITQISGSNSIYSLSDGCGGGTSTGRNKSEYINLKPGTYQLEVSAEFINSLNRSSASIKVTLFKKRVIPYNRPKYVGGVRIKSIKSIDSDGQIINEKRFSYLKKNNNGENRSSGVLFYKPLYHYEASIQSSSNPSFLCKVYSVSSNTVSSLGDGAHVGYTDVIIQEKNGENGYELITYGDEVYNSTPANRFPFPPNSEQIKTKGKMLSHKTFNKDMNLLREEIYIYDTDPSQNLRSQGNLKVGKYYPNHEQFLSSYLSVRYNNKQVFSYLKTKQELSYDPNSSFISNITNYYYDRLENHSQPTRIEVVNQDNSKIIYKMKYAADYVRSNNIELSFIKPLLKNHMISTVIEKQTWKHKQGLDFIVGSVINEYDTTALQPAKVWFLEPMNLQTSLSNDNSNGNYFESLFSDNQTRFKLKQEIFYNSNKQVVLINNQGNDFTSFIYDEKDRLISKCQNALPDQIWFENFEGPTGSSEIGDCRSGYKSSRFGYFKMLTNLKLGDYFLSYWTKENNEWKFHTQTVKLNTDTYVINLVGSVDDIRFYPKEGYMTSFVYSYDMSSLSAAIDANDKYSWYRYDMFNRLAIILDDSNNILKSFRYHYVGEN